jgi:uncharacterized membrane protein (UPF0136 family)
MTTLLSIGAFINFLVVVIGIPYFLWSQKPSGGGTAGTIWWVVISAVVLVFGVISLVAGLQLATDTEFVTHILVPIGVLFMLYVFFRRLAPARF